MNNWQIFLLSSIKADEFDSVDSKLQVWNEINNMINTRAVQFTEVTAINDLKDLLNAISKEAGNVEESVIKQDIEELQKDIEETIKKLETVKE